MNSGPSPVSLSDERHCRGCGELLSDPKTLLCARCKTNRITNGEARVIALVAQGFPNKEIAARLGLTSDTVKTYVSRILIKTGAANRTSLAIRAIQGQI